MRGKKGNFEKFLQLFLQGSNNESSRTEFKYTFFLPPRQY